jgi:hypothetical protein
MLKQKTATLQNINHIFKSYIPGTVKLRESPGRAGVFPIGITNYRENRKFVHQAATALIRFYAIMPYSIVPLFLSTAYHLREFQFPARMMTSCSDAS